MNLIDQPRAMQTALGGETGIIVRRSFAAPPEGVWRALTDPAVIPRWMWAFDWPMTTCEIDPRPGGSFTFRHTGPEGASFFFTGPILQVEPPHRMVHREPFNGDPAKWCEVTTLPAAEGGGTRMEMTMRHADAASRAAAIETGMTDGMDVVHGKPDAMLVAGEA
ncbi:MAG: SRPBCC domain-containing protein [Rhodobacteraceae bacterium]|nr:SRPBCC domain-containing protein [Paracoccaceae bacterium]